MREKKGRREMAEMERSGSQSLALTGVCVGKGVGECLFLGGGVGVETLRSFSQSAGLDH